MPSGSDPCLVPPQQAFAGSPDPLPIWWALQTPVSSVFVPCRVDDRWEGHSFGLMVDRCQCSPGVKETESMGATPHEFVVNGVLFYVDAHNEVSRSPECPAVLVRTDRWSFGRVRVWCFEGRQGRAKGTLAAVACHGRKMYHRAHVWDHGIRGCLCRHFPESVDTCMAVSRRYQEHSCVIVLGLGPNRR